MDTKKLLIGTVVGGITYFVLGFLIFGVLLADMMQGPCMRAPEEMVWWAMIGGNLGYALLLSYIFLKAGIGSLGSGLQTGAIVGLLVALTVDLMTYSLTTTFPDMTGIAVDVIGSTVLGAAAGAAIGKVIGSGSAPAA